MKSAAGQHKMRIAVAVAGLLLLLVALSGCDELEYWTVVNRLEVPITVYISDVGAPILPPHAEKTFGTVITGAPKWPPPQHAVKAYEFVPGEGNLVGWLEKDGTPVDVWSEEVTTVYGKEGDLIFCRVYSRKELEEKKLVVTISEVNVAPNVIDRPPSSIYWPPKCP